MLVRQRRRTFVFGDGGDGDGGDDVDHGDEEGDDGPLLFFLWCT